MLFERLRRDREEKKKASKKQRESRREKKRQKVERKIEEVEQRHEKTLQVLQEFGVDNLFELIELYCEAWGSPKPFFSVMLFGKKVDLDEGEVDKLIEISNIKDIKEIHSLSSSSRRRSLLTALVARNPKAVDRHFLDDKNDEKKLLDKLDIFSRTEPVEYGVSYKIWLSSVVFKLVLSAHDIGTGYDHIMSYKGILIEVTEDGIFVNDREVTYRPELIQALENIGLNGGYVSLNNISRRQINKVKRPWMEKYNN